MAGPREYIIERIGQFAEAGVDGIMFGAIPTGDVEAFQRVLGWVGTGRRQAERSQTRAVAQHLEHRDNMGDHRGVLVELLHEIKHDVGLEVAHLVDELVEIVVQREHPDRMAESAEGANHLRLGLPSLVPQFLAEVSAAGRRFADIKQREDLQALVHRRLLNFPVR